MALWVIVLIVVYALGYAVSWRLLAYWFAVDISGDAVPEGEWLVNGMVLAIFYATAWPLIAAGWGVRCAYRWREHNVAALVVPRSVLKRAELDEREQRIAAMEREVGIK